MHGSHTQSRTFARAVAITSLGFLVVQLDVSIVNIALARIGMDLQTDLSRLQWTVDGYTLAFAALLMSAGALGDRIGARRVFVGGMALFTAASLACGLALGPGLLLTGQSPGSRLAHPQVDPGRGKRAAGDETQEETGEIHGGHCSRHGPSGGC